VFSTFTVLAYTFSMTPIEKPSATVVSKEALEEFKEIYRKEYGKDISDDEAMDLAVNLLGLFKCIYRSLPKNTRKEGALREG